MNFQTEKKLVQKFYRAIETSENQEIASVFNEYCSDKLLWRGFHPFNMIRGSEEVSKTFWQPFLKSIKKCQRREDIFLAGFNEIQGHEGIWVVSMGHLMGLFDENWLGIPATHKLIMLRYCEFNKIEKEKIIETAMFFDIPHLMVQAGIKPFTSQTAAHLVQPGPRTHDGLLFEKQDEKEGKKTKEAIESMVSDLQDWKSFDHESLKNELKQSWNDDMIWWGPEGIGATYTIDRYASQHSGPFRAGFKDRKFVGHICRIAEGNYGGFFGWPNLSLIPNGDFMGMPSSQIPGEMRVIDIYRREGKKLSENWIFIDLLHFWKMQGIDILEKTLTKELA